MQARQVTIQEGQYQVHNFKGVHGSYLGDYVYLHEVGSASVKINTDYVDATYDVRLTVTPKTAENPRISIKSTYSITVEGMQIQNGMVANFTAISIEGAQMPIFPSPISAKMSRQEIQDGGIVINLEQTEEGETELTVDVDPGKMVQSTIMTALSTFGLLRPTKLTGTLKPEQNTENTYTPGY